jgi:hypothetical protein
VILTGHTAIAYAEIDRLLLQKYADFAQPARNDLSIAEARAVAERDPTLVYLDLDAIKVG